MAAEYLKGIGFEVINENEAGILLRASNIDGEILVPQDFASTFNALKSELEKFEPIASKGILAATNYCEQALSAVGENSGRRLLIDPVAFSSVAIGMLGFVKSLSVQTYSTGAWFFLPTTLRHLKVLLSV
jgi:hypothetical protein